ncbi:MFS transporter [Peribacillus alkalitolerans]|uniref:MFS transporter n=1 Tax=Peribacillus alkalitolerans TaxID=1550385 RepID=UPI0013CFF7F7|nr:MFS transporter [Peribacillus alkalitolerans]
MGYSPEIIKLNEKYSILNGAASTFSNGIVTSYIPLLAISVVGASNHQVGLISSLPSLMTMIAMIPGAWWINRLDRKKGFTAASIFAARFFIFLLLLIPFLNREWQAWILVGVVAAMGLPNAIATLSWQSFIGDLIPDERRGAFFSERNRVLTLVGLIVTFLTGFIMQFFDKHLPGPYQVVFLICFIFGLIEVFYLIKHKEIPLQRMKVETSRGLGNSLSIFKHKPYFYFLVCAILFNFGWQMAWPLFNIYQINYAHASAFWISLFTVANQISQMASYKWWGRSAEKWGNSVMLSVAGIGMASAPILTILSKNLIYLTLINLLTGIFVAGTVMLLFNQLLHVSPDHNRTSFIANYNFLIAGMGFIAPQFGVYLLEAYSMNSAMIISTVLRIVGGISFLFVVLYIDRQKLRPFKRRTA